MSKTSGLLLWVSAAELREQISSMQAGFGAYSQAVKHHSLTLAHLQSELKELKVTIIEKDAAIHDLQEAKAKMAADMEVLQRTVDEMRRNYGKEV